MAGLLVLAVVAWLRDPRSEPARPAAVRWLLLVLAGGVLLVLPFHLSFDPAARGIGVVEEGAGSPAGCATRCCSYGSLAALVAFAYAGRLLATARPAATRPGSSSRRCSPARCSRRSAGRTSRCCSPRCWSPLRALLAARVTPAERLVWLLVTGGVACLLGPELLYVRDEFDGSDAVPHEHRLQARLPGLAAARAGRDRRARALAARGWRAARLRLGVRGRWHRCSSRRRRASTRSRAPTRARAASRAAPTLDGLGWLRDRAPGDVGAIDWLNDHVADGAPSCSRRSATTTRPSATAASRPSPACRRCSAGPATSASGGTTSATARAQVVRAYMQPHRGGRRCPCCARYDVRYVVVGPLERTDYGDARRREVGRARPAACSTATARRSGSCGSQRAPWRT